MLPCAAVRTFALLMASVLLLVSSLFRPCVSGHVSATGPGDDGLPWNVSRPGSVVTLQRGLDEVLYTYDAQGALHQVTTPEGEIHRYTRRSDGLLTGITQPGAAARVFDYDDFDRQTVERIGPAGLGGQVTQTSFTGPLATTTYPGGAQIATLHDGRGRAVRTTISGVQGGVVRRFVALRGDDQPESVREVFADASAQVSSYGYSARGELTTVREPGRAQVSFDRTLQGGSAINLPRLLGAAASGSPRRDGIPWRPTRRRRTPQRR